MGRVWNSKDFDIKIIPQIVLNEATKRKSPNALSFGETQREFGDTAMVKPHLAITHTRELLGKSARAELVKIYGVKVALFANLAYSF